MNPATKLKIAFPLAIAVVLAAVFLLLALQVGRSSERGAVAQPRHEAPTAETVPVAIRVPQNAPGEPISYEKQRRERYGGRYPRWNIREFPNGWDGAIASDIHAFFEAMELDPENPSTDLQQIRQEFRDYLATLGPEALPTLAAILGVEADFVDRRFLLYAVGELGPQSEEATLILQEFFLARYEQSGSRSEMIHAIDAMGRLENDTAYDTLTRFAARADMHSFRPKLIEALGDHPHGDDALGMVIGFLHEDPLPNVRNKSAQYLGKIRDDETLGEVYRAVEKEHNWVVKQTLLGTIGKIGNPASVPFLEDHARNAPESGVRLSAARAITRIDTPYARRVFREILRSEPDPKVKKTMEKWLQE